MADDAAVRTAQDRTRTRSSSTAERSAGQATIGDVALLADVSVATVSRALRGLPNVAVETRRRIEQAASELRYRPHPAAARLAAGRTSTVTIGVPALNSWYFANVVAGAEAICSASGYEVQVVRVDDAADLARLVDPSARLERRTDALVLVDIDLDADLAHDLDDRGVVVCTTGFHVDGFLAVQIDDVEVGRIAGRHLTEIGCERLAVLMGLPDDVMRFRVSDLRRAGFEEVVGRERRIAAAEFSIDGGRRAMASILDRAAPGERPDGVFAMTDEMAFGAIMELRARHIPIGQGADSVALMGVDDHEFATVADLTTVRQDVVEVGASAARSVLGAIQHHAACGDCSGSRGARCDHLAVGFDEVTGPGVHLVRRASTAPARCN